MKSEPVLFPREKSTVTKAQRHSCAWATGVYMLETPFKFSMQSSSSLDEIASLIVLCCGMLGKQETNKHMQQGFKVFVLYQAGSFLVCIMCVLVRL